jgi:fructose-bisphosphate aldolase class II
MAEIVGPAAAAGRGVGAFNVIGIEHAEAIVTGAEAAGAPVVLQISENCAAYHGALEPIARACLAVARAAAVPVAVHLDHASSAELVRAASSFGLGSVMYDASGLPYEENVRATAEVAGWCRDRGVWVEAELGEIGGKNGVHSPLARTDPGRACGFVADTGVDALAVAVGSSHAMLTRDAVLDLGLIGRIRRAVGVPLVLHGSSGVPEADLAAAIRAGMTKINIATRLNKAFTAAVRDYLIADPAAVDPRRYGSAGRDAIVPEVVRLLNVLEGGAGEPLSPVERAARVAGLEGTAPGGGRGQGAERVGGDHPPGLRRPGQPADADQDPRRRGGRGRELRPAAALQDRAPSV